MSCKRGVTFVPRWVLKVDVVAVGLYVSLNSWQKLGSLVRNDSTILGTPPRRKLISGYAVAAGDWEILCKTGHEGSQGWKDTEK